MQVAGHLRAALQLWSRRRTQALLSTLGITAGVTGLILVIAIGEGASRELRSALGALGSGSMILQSQATHDTENPLTTGLADTLQRLAGQRLQRTAPVRLAQHTVQANQAALEQARIVGTNRHYPGFLDLKLHSGRFITDYDQRHGTRICVLGWETGRTLFPRGQVIGQQVRIQGDWYKVVGLLKPSSSQLPELDSLSLQGLDEVVYVPLHTALFSGREQSLDELMLRFSDESSLMGMLELVRRVVGSSADDARVQYVIPIQLLRHKQRVQQLFRYLLSGIAALMLVVGGVGMMNIMLFNVLSRRPEIGLRRAIGATRDDILRQFVTESMIIAVAGGIAGIVLGMALAVVIDLSTSWQLAISGGAALFGFFVSLLVGGLFGSYPAMQAATVSPMASLRQ